MPPAVPDENRAVAGALVAAVLTRALEPAAGRDVQLAAQDRLHPAPLAGRVEVHAPEEIAVVGERDGGEAEVLGLLDELLEARGAIEEAVLGMHVQVNEVGVLFHVVPVTFYSHSMVLGGLDEISKTTRFTPLTSLMMRFEILPRSSYGKRAQSAVMASWLITARNAMT